MKLLLSIILILAVFQIVHADVPPEQQPEVEHLLDFVRQSDCVLIRNGSEYSGKKGVSHIQKKYDYFRDDITSTEAFIEYSATKSTMSGKDYTIRCPGKKEIRTKDWLLNELNDFRKKTGSDAPAR
ncbi:MAG: hypothetical protein IEMM0001_0600 [bacterium]|nr:MAG: hypothetical protein IEMM0001_0600 [bacterium]